jgi:hypothetical protein
MSDFENKAAVTPIHFDEKSAFRPCGRGLVEFFKSTERPLFGQLYYFRVGGQNEAAGAAAAAAVAVEEFGGRDRV